MAPTWRFRPYGDDPEMSVMDIMWRLPVPAGTPPPPLAPLQWLGFDDHFVEVPELMRLLGGPEVAGELDQDVAILAENQRGLRSLQKG